MTAEQVLKKEDLPHLFDRFYRGNSENASGYGIGLALCKMIIVRQGGTVSAKIILRAGRCLLFVSQSDKSLT